MHIKKLFGADNGIEKHTCPSACSFRRSPPSKRNCLRNILGLPANIQGYITDFDAELSDEEFSNPHYAYRIFFVPKTANRKGQADRVIEFVKSDSALAEAVNKEYAVIKETEKKKYLPKQVVDLMKAEGYPGFSVHYHTQLWQSLDARECRQRLWHSGGGKDTWHWYERWVDVSTKALPR